MPIDYVCPHCHSKFYVDDAYRGQSGPCAECGKTITIPGMASGSAEYQSSGKVELLKKRAFNARMIRIGVLSASVLVAVTICYLLALVLLPEMEKIGIRRDALKSSGNLQRIANALNEYASQYGTYPPPVVSDASGKQLYSWRVLILPQLGYQELFSRVQLNEAWDGVNNQMLWSSMPEVYRLVGTNEHLSDWETAVSLVTGAGTLFPPSSPLGPNAMADHPATTILVTEALRNDNNWMAPFDCTLTSATQIGITRGTDVGTSRMGVAVAASVLESTLIIPTTVSIATLRALITPNGQENIVAKDFSTDRINEYVSPGGLAVPPNNNTSSSTSTP